MSKKILAAGTLSLSLLAGAPAFALFGVNNIVMAPRITDRTDCTPAVVQQVLKDVAAQFGTVQIASGYRSPADNKRRGGVDGSQHLHCQAIDFLINGRASRATQQKLQKFLLAEQNKYRTRYNVYCTGRAHIDNNTQGLPDSYSSCVERETWRDANTKKTYTRTRVPKRKYVPRRRSYSY